MASSSSRTWKYGVFASFYGPDVPERYVSHLRKHISDNGITMFNEEGIIAPALKQAIGESMISIVVLSENYASSSWCLDELVEILKCKEAFGQTVMTVFYGVDPSNVRKQTGEFGRVFNEACEGKTEEERQTWSQVLTDVGNIAGECFLNWNNASDLIEKIARDVSDKLNTTSPWDMVENMVGTEAHSKKMQPMLHLDSEEVRMIGIWGPAGIGKTTIARVLFSQLSSSFDLSCFIENMKGSYNSGLDDYGLKLSLQQQFLSNISFENGIRIDHLGAVKERLSHKKVLLILDDVDDLLQLQALANETSWFGPGSRIIVTTEDQKLLEQHGINNAYHVGFPTAEEAFDIFCEYAFGRRSRPDGFEKLIKRVTKLCRNLPLGLRIMGLSLRGKKENEWKVILHRLENSHNQDIEGVLRVVFDSLPKNDQLLFLDIAFKGNDHVKAIASGSNIDVRLGLKTLAYKSLIQISTEGNIVMHKLLQQVGREAVQRQRSEEQVLIHADEIRDVLENDSGATSLTGKSLIQISTEGKQVGIGAVRRKWPKEQVLIHADEIRDVLENDSGSTSVTGKSLIQISTEGKQVRREAVKRQRHEEQVVIHADEFRDVIKNDSDSTSVTGKSLLQIPIEGIQVGRQAVQRQKPSSSNKSIVKSKSRCFTRMTFLVVINLLLEIASAVADQLSSIRKPYFARISLVMSILSVVLSILDLTYKIRAHNARFRCKWPIPWFYYPSCGYNRIFGSFTDTVLLFCVVGQLIVSTINYSFIERRRDGPIKVSVWPLFFAIGMVGSKFMEKPTISKDNSCNKCVLIDLKLNE